MKAYQTGVIPIRFRETGMLTSFKTHCVETGLLHPYVTYSGRLNLTSIKDISIGSFEYYYICSGHIDIQCAFCGDTIVLIVSKLKDFDDYYDFINSVLKSRSVFVKEVLGYQSNEQNLARFLQLIKTDEYQAMIHYVFTFFAIYDQDFSDKTEIHAKILAEPSIINLDDMLCSDVSNVLYSKDTVIDASIAEGVEDIDLNSDQWTFVTWASIVTVSRNEDLFLQNHLITILLEIHTQYVWNLSYDQGLVIDKYLGNRKVSAADTTEIVAGTYRILLEAKSIISATLSSRVSRLNKAILRTSQLSDITETLDKKLNYLIVLADMSSKEEVKRTSTVSEVLLFLVALAQVFPLFFDMPFSVSKVWGYITIPVLCVMGIWLILRKFKQS